MPTLGLAMIVKNAADTLSDAVLSVAGIVDQIVVADTGSTDGTVQLARDLGAKVFSIPWQDDFSHARNASLQALTTDWALVMDDDEELDPPTRIQLPRLLQQSAEIDSLGGFYLTLRNYIPARTAAGGHAPSFRPVESTLPRARKARAYSDFSLCRLFRRHPQIYYSGRVHEKVEPQIQALGLKISTTDLVIQHFGILCSSQERLAKDQLYRKLGRLKVQDFPRDPQAWIELGLQEYEQFKNYSAGIECFRKSLALDPNFSNVPYLSLASLYVEIQADARALELLAVKPMSGRAAGEKEQICGDALYNLGRLPEARAAYLRALRILADDPRLLSKLGLTEIRLGLKKNGLARLKRALQSAPEVFDMHDRLIKGFLLMNLLPEAAAAAENLAAASPAPATMLRAASIRAQNREWKAAEKVVLRGLELFPENPDLLKVKSELEAQLTPALHPSSGASPAVATR